MIPNGRKLSPGDSRLFTQTWLLKVFVSAARGVKRVYDAYGEFLADTVLTDLLLRSHPSLCEEVIPWLVEQADWMLSALWEMHAQGLLPGGTDEQGVLCLPERVADAADPWLTGGGPRLPEIAQVCQAALAALPLEAAEAALGAAMAALEERGIPQPQFKKPSLDIVLPPEYGLRPSY